MSICCFQQINILFVFYNSYFNLDNKNIFLVFNADCFNDLVVGVEYRVFECENFVLLLFGSEYSIVIMGRGKKGNVFYKIV